MKQIEVLHGIHALRRQTRNAIEFSFKLGASALEDLWPEVRADARAPHPEFLALGPRTALFHVSPTLRDACPNRTLNFFTLDGHESDTLITAFVCKRAPRVFVTRFRVTDWIRVVVLHPGFTTADLAPLLGVPADDRDAVLAAAAAQTFADGALLVRESAIDVLTAELVLFQGTCASACVPESSKEIECGS